MVERFKDILRFLLLHIWNKAKACAEVKSIIRSDHLYETISTFTNN